MKNIRFFLPENSQFWVVKFSVYLNRHVFVMNSGADEVVHFKLSMLEEHSLLDAFYNLPYDSGGVLWFHVGCPCVCLSVHISFLDNNLSKL